MLALPSELREALDRGGKELTVLAVRLGAMGDILRTLPPVRLLRRALPHAVVVWVCDDRWGHLLDGHPDLDGVVALPRKAMAAASPLRRPALLAGFRRTLRLCKADLVLDFHGNLRSGLVGWCSGAAVRVGYAGHQQKEGNRWFTTHRVPSGERRTPRMRRNLDLIEALGIDSSPLPDGGLDLVRRGAAAAGEIVEAAGLGAGFGVLSPAASAAQAYKIPPPELFAAAAGRLREQGRRVLVVWGPGELPIARRVVELGGGAATLAPDTDLPTLAALIAGAGLYIGADSGPLHLACAVGTPALSLYGPTDPVVNQPWGVPFRTVAPPGAVYTGIKREDRKIGFAGLSAERVRVALDELLDQIPPLRA